MGKGISIFLGMDDSLESILELITFSREKGFDKIFTSFHIPEANYSIILEEFKQVSRLAKRLGMKIIADISPKAFKFLGIEDYDIVKIKEFGIDVLRLDFGYSEKVIADLTRNELGLKVEINASTVTERFFYELDKYKPNYENIQACHNYYPRKNTGISEALFIKKNHMLRERGMRVSAFIPSISGRRGPIYEGLPTLEAHRDINPYISAKHMTALGIDDIFFGDGNPSKEEIIAVGSIKTDSVELRINPFVKEYITSRYINFGEYSNRADCAEDVIRAVESRGLLLENEVIEPANCITREVGSITLDNKAYLRYMGELQIVKKKLQQDNRVNVIARVVEEDLFLLDYISEESKFYFKVIGD